MWRFLFSLVLLSFGFGAANAQTYTLTIQNNTGYAWNGNLRFNCNASCGCGGGGTKNIPANGTTTGTYSYDNTASNYVCLAVEQSSPDGVYPKGTIDGAAIQWPGSYIWGTMAIQPMGRMTANHTLVINSTATADCQAATLSWGASNFCQASVPTTAPGGSFGMTNTKTGATGSATATCSSGSWAVSSPTCTANMSAPTGMIASDGTNPSAIDLTWGAVPGASTYRIQYRVQGSPTWADLTTTAATSYSWATANYSTYEFQVRAENPSGSSVFSASDLGWIRPLIDSAFVSQTGIPAKVGVGQSFTFSQVWRNTGSETWTGASYGTASHGTNGAITWGVPFTVFAGSTANSAQVTQTLTATAPATPGTYTLQRIMQKSGTSYGTPSTLASIVVLGTPQCSAVTPDIATTYNPNATVTAKLAGASSVEAATIRVWGDIQGEPNGATYSMAFNGTDWVATFPVASHLSPSENKINIRASVSNSEFPSSVCATSSMAFEQLPLPVVTLTPTFGSYAEGADQGFVVNRASGEFAKVLVDLGSYSSSLKAKVEVLDVAQANTILPLNNVTPNAQTNMVMTPTTLAGTPASWVKYTATVRVSYADAVAAAQNKVATVSISWTAAPTGLIVNATGIDAATATIAAAIAPSAASFDSALHGSFTGYARIASNATSVGSTQAVDTTGAWNVSNLDYSQLYATPLVAVARAVPPAGITLVTPLEFVSAAFTLPVQRPLSVSATDGTREDDVQVVWPAVATGSAIRYRVFRDGVEVSPVVGISSLEFIDTPPVRGTVYTYSIKTMVNNVSSTTDANDTGFVPACRAPRLVGASLNADMTAITGLVERWDCLTEAKGTGSVDTGSGTDVTLDGSTTYRSFSYPLDPTLPDGAHVMHLGLQSQGVTINADRTYDIPFTLAKSAITIKSLTILYDGNTAKDGMDASSIGRFGVRMEGGTGLGFAEESQ